MKKTREKSIPHIKDGEGIYQYKRGAASLYLTIAILVFITLGFIYLYLTSSGNYISAWYLSLVIALVTLQVLSFPGYIKTGRSAIEIHCILEVSIIPYENIVKIKPLAKESMKWCIPLLVSYGFGGYFGYYINLRQLKVSRLYATDLNTLVAIKDIYSDLYVVSCEDVEKFIDDVNSRRIATTETNSNE